MNLKYNFFTSSDVSKLAIDVEFIPHLPVHLPLTQSDGDEAKRGAAWTAEAGAQEAFHSG